MKKRSSIRLSISLLAAAEALRSILGTVVAERARFPDGKEDKHKLNEKAANDGTTKPRPSPCLLVRMHRRRKIAFTGRKRPLGAQHVFDAGCGAGGGGGADAGIGTAASKAAGTGSAALNAAGTSDLPKGLPRKYFGASPCSQIPGNELQTSESRCRSR